MELKDYIESSTFYGPNIKPDRKPTQGDIIIPYKGLYKGPEEKLVGKNIIGIILLTNKCDIEHNRAKYITFCPIYKASKIVGATNRRSKDYWKKIIKENHDFLFFIPPHPEIDPHFGGVIFYQDIRSEIRDSFYEKYPRPTLTLKRPYIDRLCSRIANFFNRIPINLPNDDQILCWIEDCVEKGKEFSNESSETHLKE